MATALYSYATKTMEEVRDDILRTISNGLRQINGNDPNFTPNVGPNSDYYAIATGLAIEIAVGLANNKLLADQLMPDTAGGTQLDRWLTLVGLKRREAVSSSGLITPTYSAASTLVTQGLQLLDTAGLRYQVSIGGMYGTGAGLSPQIPVTAVDAGAATNHANGDVLRWVNAPAYTSQQVVVGTPGASNGLTGGADSEIGVDEPPRQRLFAVLQNPPKSGNWSDIAEWCAESTPAVQQGFVYPALLGPASVFFAVTQAAQGQPPYSATSKNRDMSTTTVNTVVVPYVNAKMPEHVFCAGATVGDQYIDVAVQLALPATPTASPPGPGGGWLDATPWPSTLGGTFVPAVTAVFSPTLINIQMAGGAPIPTSGATHVSYISTQSWTLYTATVLNALSLGSGRWQLTLDSPFPDVQSGNYIFPASVNQSTYAAAALQAFSVMGPGEWSTNPTVLQRAFRHPLPFPSWPYRLDANFLRALENAGPEVLTAQFLFMFTNGGSIPISPPPAPNVPTGLPSANALGVVTSPPPNVFVPRNIGFYAS